MLIGPLHLQGEEPVFSFKATATGVDDSTPLEFILITPDSGHDYESVAISTLSAQEVVDGLIELGAVAAHPADPGTLRFWPKGEWLEIDVSFEQDEKTVTHPVGELIWNNPANTSLAEESWTFCGSILQPDENGKPTLLADLREPGSILSTYNDPETVLDRTVQASKGVVYGSLIVNTNLQLMEGQDLTFSIRRKSADKTFQAVDVPILAESTDDGFVFTIRTPAGKEQMVSGGVDHLIDSLVSMQETHPNLYVSLLPGNTLPLADVATLYHRATSIEEQHALRLNPPMSPHFFFQSFLPDPSFREPDQRPSQPWELHIKQNLSEQCIDLVRYEVVERDDLGVPTFKEQRFSSLTQEDLVKHLELKEYDLPVLLVFAPPTLMYGDLTRILDPIRDSYDTFYFYIDEE